MTWNDDTHTTSASFAVRSRMAQLGTIAKICGENAVSDKVRCRCEEGEGSVHKIDVTHILSLRQEPSGALNKFSPRGASRCRRRSVNSNLQYAACFPPFEFLYAGTMARESRRRNSRARKWETKGCFAHHNVYYTSTKPPQGSVENLFDTVPVVLLCGFSSHFLSRQITYGSKECRLFLGIQPEVKHTARLQRSSNRVKRFDSAQLSSAQAIQEMHERFRILDPQCGGPEQQQTGLGAQLTARPHEGARIGTVVGE
jgi:hypothetical protein